MSAIFPSALAPSYFNIDRLGDYGLRIIETEEGFERRIFTETTGFGTQLRVRYSGMSADEVFTLVNFYQSVKGTFGAFTLPPEFLVNPSEYNTAIALLQDTDNWRFLNPPSIETIINDIYTAEFVLVSLKAEEPLNIDTVFGFFKPPRLNLGIGRVPFSAEDEETTDAPGLTLIASGAEFTEAAVVDGVNIVTSPTSIFIVSERVMNTAALLIGYGDISGTGEYTQLLTANLTTFVPDAIGIIPEIAVGVTPSVNYTANSPQAVLADISTPTLASLTLIPDTPFAADTGLGQTTDIAFIAPSLGTDVQASRNVDPIEMEFGEFFMAFVFSSAGIGMIIQHRNSNFNAFANGIFVVDTSSNTVISQLPTNPDDSTAIIFADCTGTPVNTPATGFGLNALTINPGPGDTIQGQTDLILDVDNMGVTLVYDLSNTNWVIIANSF